MVLKKKSVNYAITLTLNPKFYTLSLEGQYDLAKRGIEDAIKKSHFDPLVTMVCEITSKNQMNCHFHGIVTLQGNAKNALPRVCERYVNDMFRDCKADPRTQIFGKQRCIKPIDDFQCWKDYIIKDYGITKGLLYCRDPVMFEDLEEIIEPFINFPDWNPLAEPVVRPDGCDLKLNGKVLNAAAPRNTWLR